MLNYICTNLVYLSPTKIRVFLGNKMIENSSDHLEIHQTIGKTEFGVRKRTI